MECVRHNLYSGITDANAADVVYATAGEQGGVQPRDFYGRIRELDLSQAGQVIIREDVPAFTRMRKLKSLILSHSNLSEIHPMWFSGMDDNQIALVDASVNQLQRLRLDKDSLPLLQVLNLSQNSLFDVSLRDFVALESLVLNSNQLRNLEFLRGFNNLKNLHAENNDLREIKTIDLQGHDSLEYVNLAINFISRVEANSFDRLTRLKYLNMSHNSLDGLQFFTIFAQMTNLEVLDVSSNQIQEIPSLQLFKMNNLRHLNVSSNFITEIPEKSFSGLFSLKQLQLDNNKILSVHPNAFIQLFALEYLDLSGNKLKSLDSNLLTIPSANLRRLFLQNNELEALSESLFLNTRKLVQLNLADNKIKAIPEFAFREMINLRVLHLEHNLIDQFSLRQLHQNRQLRVVFLHNNRLTHIAEFDRRTLGRLSKATILTIDNNPWQCACMDQMIALLSKTKINYSYEAGYFENATLKIMCVVTEECYGNLVDRHENYIRELFFGKF